MRNRIVLITCFTIIIMVFLYVHSAGGNQLEWSTLVKYLLWLLVLVSIIQYVKKELLDYADTLSSNTKIRQFYFYTQNRCFLGLKVGNILSTLPISFVLTSLIAVPFLGIEPKLRNYYLVFEIVVVLIILLLGIVITLRLPIKSIERRIIPIFLFSMAIIFMAALNFTQEKVNISHFILFSGGFTCLNLMFYQICLAGVAFLKRHISYETVFQNIVTNKISPRVLLGLINAQKPIQMLDNNNSFFVGNTNADINITLILNIFCKKSAKCLEEAHALILQNRERVNLRILFNYHIYRDDYQRNLIRSILHNYISGVDVVKILKACYKSRKEYTKYEMEGKNIDVELYDRIIEEQIKWCHNYNVVECPVTYLNGYKIPSGYNVGDFLGMFETPLDRAY